MYPFGKGHWKQTITDLMLGVGVPKQMWTKGTIIFHQFFFFHHFKCFCYWVSQPRDSKAFSKTTRQKKWPLRRSPHMISYLRLFFEGERYESFHEEGKGWAVVISEWINKAVNGQCLQTLSGSRTASHSQLRLGLSATSWMHAWLNIYV